MSRVLRQVMGSTDVETAKEKPSKTVVPVEELDIAREDVVGDGGGGPHYCWAA